MSSVVVVVRMLVFCFFVTSTAAPPSLFPVCSLLYCYRGRRKRGNLDSAPKAKGVGNAIVVGVKNC